MLYPLAVLGSRPDSPGVCQRPRAATGRASRPFSREVVVRNKRIVRLVVLAAGAAGCTNQGPCDGAMPPPDMSEPVDVSPTLACAIAVQKELAGGLTWTASVARADASSVAAAEGGSAPSFAIAQNGFTANNECTAACSYNYNECFLPTEYLEAYVGAESLTEGTGSTAEAGAGNAIAMGSVVGSACPDAASVTVTCTYSSAGFCE
jgi:hypothetical protein